MKLLAPLLFLAAAAFAEVDPATEPSVLAVAKTMPAVVNINTTGVVRQQVRDPFEDFFRGYYGRFRQPRVVQQQVQSLGTGFIVDASGYIVTNEHVVTRAEELKISV